MAYDGITLHAITHELSNTLVGGRVDKIYQPLAKEIVLRLRTRGANHQLLLSADPTHPRVHLTDTKFVNPDTPTMFCMLLRKHLENSYIKHISQWNLERVIRFEFESTNEIGDPVQFWLIVEIMGRHSNIILVDPGKKNILDSVHHVNRQVNSYRELLPGREYITPPSQEKHNLLTIEQTTLQQLYSDWTTRELQGEPQQWKKFFLANFQGISPLISSEMWFRAEQDHTKLQQVALQLRDDLLDHRYQPCIVKNAQGVYREFSAIDLTHIHRESEIVRLTTMNECVEQYYLYKTQQIFVQRETQGISQKLASAHKRTINKIVKLQDTLNNAREAERYKLMGELLTANLYQITKGQTQAEVVDYYHPDQATIVIPLDVRMTPVQNAQNYYKKYNKQKNSIPKVTEQIELAQQEQLYLESVMQLLDTADLQDIPDIRQELEEEGYLAPARDAKSKKQKQRQQSVPLKYRSSTGVEIWVGRNNKQNDMLTTQIAGKQEIWLHTKNIPGSHVVIRSQNPDDATLTEAALLAAYYSKARGSGQIPVDYTQIKNVKKPSGAKPGYVIYEQQNTIYVTPEEQQIHAMRRL